MEVGWDYSNMQKKGKNVYFFMDTHSDMGVQEKILKESYSLINQEVFDAFLCEGFSGEGKDLVQIETSEMSISEYMKNEHLLKNYFSGIKGYWSHSNLLIARSYFSPPIFNVYGVDNNELMSEAKAIVKNIHEAFTKLDDFDVDYLKHLETEFISSMDRRSDAAVNNICKYLESTDSVGVSFGKGHYEKMQRGFLDKGVGIVSYLSKDVKVSTEEGMNYLENIVKGF